jgi:hypothetical protein
LEQVRKTKSDHDDDDDDQIVEEPYIIILRPRPVSDPARWSFELHVERQAAETSVNGLHGLNPDLAFVEAFAKETAIMSKRVDACKSHVKMVTCFDVSNGFASKEGDNLSLLEKMLRENCCTTECEPAQSIVLEAGGHSETDII